jgi:S-adenosylmethionine:tRNA ribosyltransferase-isomerase
MKAYIRLTGVRVRNETLVTIEAILRAKESENSWRASVQPTGRVEVGDRLRFGDTSENPACFLAFLDADVVERNREHVLLSFHFTGVALDDVLDRLPETTP